MKPSLGKKLLLFFVVIISAIAAIAIAVWQNNKIQESKTASVMEMHRVIRLTEGISAAMEQIISSSRAYAITGDSLYLDELNANEKELTDSMKRLAEFGNDKTNKPLIDSLDKLIKFRIYFSNLVITTRNEKGKEQAEKLIGSGIGEKYRKLRVNLVNRIETEEQEALRKFEELADDSIKAFNRSFHFLTFSIIAFVALSLIVAIRQLKIRRKAEAELFLQKEWFSQTLLSLGDGVIATDRSGLITFINRSAEKLTGWKQEEALGKHVEEIFPIASENPGAKVANPALEAIRNNRTEFLANQTTLTRKDGSALFIDDSGAPIHNIGGEIVGGVLIFRDVTEKKKAQDELKAAHQRFSTLFNFSPVPIAITETETGKLLYVNSSYCSLVGKKREEIIGQTTPDLNFIDKEERQKAIGQIKAAGGSVKNFEFSIRNAAGDAIDILFSSEPILIDDYSAYIYALVDITERKKAEEKIKQLNETLEHRVSERTKELEATNRELQKTNEELDRFVYSASHDLRGPLSTLLGLIMITEKNFVASEMPERLGMMKELIQKLDGVISEIIHYSQNTHFAIAKEDISFKDILLQVRDDLKYMDGTERLKFKTEISENNHFLSDKNRLRIVLSNIISNSIQYQDKTKPEPYVNVIIHSNKEKAELIIEDNGIGIHQRDYQRIFNMFYRGTAQSKGSGLGLYVVKEIVSALNGKVAVESEITVGSRFTITIPNLA